MTNPSDNIDIPSQAPICLQNHLKPHTPSTHSLPSPLSVARPTNSVRLLQFIRKKIGVVPCHNKNDNWADEECIGYRMWTVENTKRGNIEKPKRSKYNQIVATSQLSSLATDSDSYRRSIATQRPYRLHRDLASERTRARHLNGTLAIFRVADTPMILRCHLNRARTPHTLIPLSYYVNHLEVPKVVEGSHLSSR